MAHPVSQVTSQPETCTFPTFCPGDSGCHECAEMQEVNRPIVFLEERRSSALSRINARRDLLTTKLPLEVICRIFEEYVELYPQKYGSPTFYPFSRNIHIGIPVLFSSFSPRAPLSLGAVCRQWRNIAWSHPPLWNNLEIDLSPPGHEHGPTIVNEWLTRSQSLPLNIRISDGEGLDDTSEEHAVATMNILKQFSSRWRCLDICIQQSTVMYDLEDSYFSDNQSTGCPSTLQRLSLTGFSNEIPFEKMLYSSHWTQLSHLHVSEIHVGSLRWILERIAEIPAPFTHLSVDQVLEGIGEDSLEWLVPSLLVVRLPTLLALSITQPSTDGVFAELLGHLIAPALRSLKCDLTGPLSVTSLISFILQSACSLQEVVISCFVDVHVESIPPLLRALPALADLSLVASAPIAALFCKLLSQATFQTDNAPILPRLKRLTLDLYGPVDWPSIIGIYVEDPSTIRHPRDQTDIPQVPIPGRVSLQLSVFQQITFGRGHTKTEPIDIPSLVAFAYLRKQYGVVFRAQQWEDRIEWPGFDQLVPSYCQSDYYDSAQPEDTILKSLRELAALAL